MLAAPETLPLFLRKLQRKSLKQYQRREPIYKGSGDIICMLDESGSTAAQASWCKAVALALLDICTKWLQREQDNDTQPYHTALTQLLGEVEEAIGVR